MLIAELAQSTLPELPGALSATVEDAARRVIKHFCKETHCFVRNVSLQIEAGIDAAEVPVPYKTEVLAIQSLVEGNSFIVATFGNTRLKLRGPAKQLEVFVVRAVLQPTTGMTKLPEELDRWESALRYGVLAEMYKMPGQPFTNLNLFQHYDALYRSEICDAKRLNNHGYGFGRKTVPMRPLA